MNAHAQAHLLAAKLLAHRIESADLNDILSGLSIVKLLRRIDECKEQTYRINGIRSKSLSSKHPGFVALVVSGCDCDGVRYSGEVHFVKASYDAVTAEWNRITHNADGPCHIEMAKPSEVEDLEYESRDLGMEAFEDGHPHCLHA